MQRLGLNAIAELLVEGRHPKLYDHRKRKNCHQGKRELDGLGVDDALHRGLHQLKANEQHERCHDQAGKILVATVTVGVLGVGRPARQLKAQHAHDVRTGIGQVVHGVRHDRDRSRHHADGTLCNTKCHIGENAHHTCQRAHTRAIALCTLNNPLDHLYPPHVPLIYLLFKRIVV